MIYFLLTAFAGYAIGRISHIYGGHLKSPHHWIYGLMLIVFGLIYRESPWGYFAVSFGIGHFISDLKDFMNLKFYGVDDVKIKKFWGID
jgi:hypothetical protein